MPQLHKKTLVADLDPTPTAPPSAEVRVAPRTLCVTIHLPSHEPADTEILVTRSTLRFRLKSKPGADEVLVPLPLAVEPGRFVARHKNGVFDVLVERTTRSH